MTLICQFCQCPRRGYGVFVGRTQRPEAGGHRNRKPKGTGDFEWYRQVTSLQFRSRRRHRRSGEKTENRREIALSFLAS